MKCAVANCGSKNNGKAGAISFFTFPKDQTLTKKWIKFCRRIVDAKSSHVCIKHFNKDDILNNQQIEMGLAKRRVLKPGAVPSIFTENLEKSKRAERAQQRGYKKIVNDLLKQSESEAGIEGFCKWRILKKNAVPSIFQQDTENVETVETTQRQEYKNIVDKLLREYEEGKLYDSQSFEEPSKVKRSTSPQLQKISTKTEALINEALFDDEEIFRQENTSLTTAKDNEILSIRSSIDLNSDLDSVSPISKSDDNHHMGYQSVSSLIVSKCIQTDEAAEDRINCGFVNVSKSGTDKYFNLRCFYCDAEYPISFWSEFSEHILHNHGHLEKVFTQNDELEFISREYTVIHDGVDSTQRILEEEMEPINYINLDDIGENGAKVSAKKKKKDRKCEIETLSETSDTVDATEPYMYEENYVPTADHSYSQTVANKSINFTPLKDAAKPIDEIDFDKTPRYIMLDFLDHLKGFPSLWRERKIDCEEFDHDLTNLMEIMRLKWELNPSMSSLYKNLESIKAWFNGIRDSKESSGNSNVQHLFDEYYEKCLELVTFDNATKKDLLRCDLCNRANASIAKLQAHKFLKHGLGQLPYGCNKCNKRFVYIEKFVIHIGNHKRKTEEKNKRIEKLIRMASMPKKEPLPSPAPRAYECFECNILFSSENEYKLHLDIHPKGDCPLACEECGARYKNNHTLSSHKKRAHTSEVYQCHICLLRTTTSRALKVHMDAHNGVCKYVCEWCGKKFVCRKYWREHCLFEHCGYGKCKICNREYKKRTILRKHLRTLHRPLFGTNEELFKPFEMKFRCGPLKRKPRKPREKGGGNLKLRKYEYVIDPVTKKRRLKCPKCDENFYTYNSVRKHALQIHNYDCRTIERGEREGHYISQRMPKRQQPQREENKNKLFKYYWKRRVKIVDNKPIYIDSDEIEANAEVEKGAFNAISKCSDSNEFEILHQSDGDSEYNPTIDTKEFEEDKTVIEISFEKLVDEISTNNISLQSPIDQVEAEAESSNKFS